MGGIDLNFGRSRIGFGRLSLAAAWRDGVACTRRSHRLHATGGLHPPACLQALRGAVRGKIQVRAFFCHDQRLRMGFAQLTLRERRRDIAICLRALQPELSPVGLRGGVFRGTFTHANETRDRRLYADFVQAMIRGARRPCFHDRFDDERAHTAYAFDSTSFDLGSTFFPWARFRRAQGAVTCRTPLDLRAHVLTVMAIPHGRRPL